MKKLGLIGGMGPESTIPYYHDIVYGVQKTIGEQEFSKKAGDSIFIPTQTKHRIRNEQNTSLTFIEVQYGDILDEEDIIRYEDIYGRA